MNRMIVEQTIDSEVFYKYLLEKKEIENQFRSPDVWYEMMYLFI